MKNRLHVYVLGADNTTLSEALLPPDLDVEHLLPSLVKKLCLSMTTGTGESLEYQLVRVNDRLRIPPTETLREAGICEDDTLQLMPFTVSSTQAQPQTVEQEPLPGPDLIKTLNNISNALESSKTVTLTTEHRAAIDQLMGMVTAEQTQLTAPILIPSDLKVKLVPINLVHSLEESADEQKKWENVTSLFIGAILSLIIAWATSPQFTITSLSLILLGMMIFFTLLSATSAFRFRRRVKQIRKRIEPPEQN